MTREITNYLPLLFSSQVVSDSLQPYELQHVSVPCPVLSPGACSNSCPLSQWYHSTISSSVTPFSSFPQSFPALESFPKSRLFISDGQSIGASALASVLPMNSQGWFPLGLTGLVSFFFFCPRGFQESSLTPQFIVYPWAINCYLHYFHGKVLSFYLSECY